MRCAANGPRNAEIIRRRKAGEWPRAIARDMGLTHNAVIGVCNRAGLSGVAGRLEVKRTLSESDVREIRRDYRKGVRGFGCVSIARRYGVDDATVWNVVNGKTWTHVA